MDLSHNQVFWIASGQYAGLYRTIFDFPDLDKVVVARIGDPPDPPKEETGAGRPNKRVHASFKREKSSRALVGRPIFLPRRDLEVLLAKHELRLAEIKLDSIFYETFAPPDNATSAELERYNKSKIKYDRRLSAMQPLFDLNRLRSCLRDDGSIGPLMKLVSRPITRVSDAGVTSGTSARSQTSCRPTSKEVTNCRLGLLR